MPTIKNSTKKIRQKYARPKKSDKNDGNPGEGLEPLEWSHGHVGGDGRPQGEGVDELRTSS